MVTSLFGGRKRRRLSETELGASVLRPVTNFSLTGSRSLGAGRKRQLLSQLQQPIVPGFGSSQMAFRSRAEAEFPQLKGLSDQEFARQSAKIAAKLAKTLSVIKKFLNAEKASAQKQKSARKKRGQDPLGAPALVRVRQRELEVAEFERKIDLLGFVGKGVKAQRKPTRSGTSRLAVTTERGTGRFISSQRF